VMRIRRKLGDFRVPRFVRSVRGQHLGIQHQGVRSEPGRGSSGSRPGHRRTIL
jgi:hypothetical protein